MASLVRNCIKRSTRCSCHGMLRRSLSRKLDQSPISLFWRYGSRSFSTDPLPSPSDRKPYPDHIVSIVDSISKLTLLEVSSLNELLKIKLDIKDVPMMPMGGAMAAPAIVEPEEDSPPEEVQTEFAVKLLKFDDTKKVKLIKEIKTVMTDFNLVQAKKFVESVPQLVKDKISKEEAEKLKAQLEAVGASVEID